MILLVINNWYAELIHTDFFGNSIVATELLGLITTVAPFLLWRQFGISIFLVYLAVVYMIRILVSPASKQNVRTNLFLLFISFAHIFTDLCCSTAKQNSELKTTLLETNVFGNNKTD